MKVNVKTKNYDLNPEIQAYLDERLEAVERLIHTDPDAVVCDVELEKYTDQRHGEVWRAETNLDIAGEFHRAEARALSMNAAIDEMKDEIIRQLRKGKRKRLDLIRRGGAKMKEIMRFGRFGKR